MPTPKPLTKEYIKDHALKIHNYESWGKALVEAILKEAALKADGSGKTIKLEIPVTVSSTKQLCIDICYGWVCIHVVP